MISDGEGVSRRCMVLGVNGQDGSYLAEHLLSAGHWVWGIGRQPQSKWLAAHGRYIYLPRDLSDSSGLLSLLHELRPDAIFHLAAVHGAAGFLYEEHWIEAHQVNTLAAHAALEFLRRHRQDGVFIYASSSKVFDVPPPGIISETSARRSTCIYSTTKNAATDLIHYYRSRHSVNAGVAWTFNHESVRRGDQYFIPRIVGILARAIMSKGVQGNVATLHFWCDWGAASEYMRIVGDLAGRAPGRDFVIATGAVHWAADFVRELFARYGLRAEDHVIEQLPPPANRPGANGVDLANLRAAIGYAPKRTIYEICDEILRYKYPDAWSVAAKGS